MNTNFDRKDFDQHFLLQIPRGHEKIEFFQFRLTLHFLSTQKRNWLLAFAAFDNKPIKLFF